MSDIDPDLRRRFMAGVDAASLTARVTFSLGTIDALNGQPQGAIYLVSAATVLDIFSSVARKWADDPPRDDYDSATRVARSTIREEVIPGEPEEPLTEAALGLIRDVDLATRNLSAGLRAFERMQGAVLRQSDLASRRATEASHYSSEAAYALIGFGARLEALADVLATQPGRWFEQTETTGGIDESELNLIGAASRRLSPPQLPSEVLAGVYVLGIPIADFDRTLKRGGVSSWRPDTTRRQARELIALGETLRAWEPKPRFA